MKRIKAICCKQTQWNSDTPCAKSINMDEKIWILLKLRHNNKNWLINQIKVIPYNARNRKLLIGYVFLYYASVPPGSTHK